MKNIEYYFEGWRECGKQLIKFMELYIKWVNDFWITYKREVNKNEQR